LLEFERQLWTRDIDRIAGVDEAGRGPLAGPVVAAAVVLKRAFAESMMLPESPLWGLTDSKKLTQQQRELFFGLLTDNASISFGVGIADVEEIDAINILRATHVAMQRALDKLSPAPEHVLVDGLPVDSIILPATAIVKGDSRSLSIAAASVIAKVTRDRMLEALDATYPIYGFARHKGYGTQAHMLTLMENGPCPAHRTSFRPVREAAEIQRRRPKVIRTRKHAPKRPPEAEQQELF
jgi:ribonuclease HII